MAAPLAEPPSAVRTRNLGALSSTVLATLKLRRGVPAGTAGEARVAEWAQQARDALREECLAWDPSQCAHFRRLCVTEANKMRAVLNRGGSPEEAATALTPISEFLRAVRASPRQTPSLLAAASAAPAHPEHAPPRVKNHWERDPNLDSDGEEILSDPFKEARSLAKSPAVTDRTAQRYGYRSAGHWRAAQGW